MAERALKGPIFYRGFYGHRSVLSEELTREQRVQFRGLYRKLLGNYPRTYHGRMQARAVMRSMLYAEVGGRRNK